jgi:hypothetical protein
MKFSAAFLFTVAAVSLAGCEGIYGDDELARYVQRSDTIILSEGNAKDVNVVTHTIHPWPPGVGDRRIPANGERMVHAMESYRARKKTEPPPGSVTSQTFSDTANSNGTSTSGQSQTTTTYTPLPP